MRLLVCGGRNFANRTLLYWSLNSIHETNPITTLIEGEAMGADKMAAGWAESMGIPVERYPADWSTYGKAAGSIRNKQMLDEGKPDVVMAFPGGAGTDNMIHQAEKAGLRVIKVPALVIASSRCVGLPEDTRPCRCYRCLKESGEPSPDLPGLLKADTIFITCMECGNKRCPHANDHRNTCTGSNEPGQKGSRYE